MSDRPGADADPTLPERVLRDHVLATAIRSAEACLAEHGYAEPDRAPEIIAYAIDDAWSEVDTNRHCPDSGMHL